MDDVAVLDDIDGRFHGIGGGQRLPECCFRLFLGLQQDFPDHDVTTGRRHFNGLAQIGHRFFQMTVNNNPKINFI